MLAEQEAEEEEDVSAPPSIEEQKAMWGGEVEQPEPQPQNQVFGDFSSGMSGSTQGISSAMGEPEATEIDPDIAELLQTSSQTTADPNSPSVSNDLLSAFEDDDSVEREEVEFSHEDTPPEESSNWEPVDEEGETDVSEEEPEKSDRTVRQNCSSCDEMFEVTMPSGVDAARTACPHCGSVESVSLD
tara:strand:- start:75 stop:635 length:561 start_codon:yes stop_codon:yes gene_type:complete